jgi:hypothetical protein
VLCVHPVDEKPDIAYEAAMIQQDTRMVLLPMLVEAMHPALRRLAEMVHASTAGEMLIEMEQTSTEAVLLEAESEGHNPSVPGWDILRLLGGEIAEIVGLASAEDMAGDKPLLLSGRFGDGGMFQMTLLPGQARTEWRFTVRTGMQKFELHCPDTGPTTLTWPGENGELVQEQWPQWNPWPGLVEVFEEAVSGGLSPILRWQDEVRCLELDDAARRSVEKRRASTLDYQEASEEVGFKGTMTLVGCALIWGSLVLLLASVWVPILAWLILPIFGVFLLFQCLRWFVQEKPQKQPTAGPPLSREHSEAITEQNRAR